MALFGGGAKSDNPQELMAKGDFEGAFKIFRKLTKKSPEDFALGLQFGEALEKKDKRDEAGAEFIRLADLQESKGHHSKALALYRRAEKLIPGRNDLLAKITASETSGGGAKKTLTASQKKSTDESFDIDMSGGGDESPEPEIGDQTLSPAVAAAHVRSELPVAEMDDEISSEDLPAIPDAVETLDVAEALPEAEPEPPSPPPPPKPSAAAAKAAPTQKMEAVKPPPAPAKPNAKITQKTGAVKVPELEPEEIPTLSTDELLAASEAAEELGTETAEMPVLKGILRELTPPESQLVLARLKSCDFEAGDTIITEGESGDSMYFIRSGKVKVSTMTPAGLMELGELQPGDYFGEVTLLKRVNRTATISAIAMTEVMELHREDLDALRPQIPNLLERLEKGLNRRAMETIAKLQKHLAKH